MGKEEIALEMNKSYGLAILLKLTKTYIRGIEVCEHNGRWATNVGRKELCYAMDMTVRDHHINVRID